MYIPLDNVKFGSTRDGTELNKEQCIQLLADIKELEQAAYSKGWSAGYENAEQSAEGEGW